MLNRMENHVLIAGVFQIGFGLLGVCLSLILFVAIFGGGVLSGDPFAMEITGFIATALSSFLLIFSVPAIIAGFGLLAHRNWARILILILSVIDLFCIPFGTILAVYTFWVLLNDDTERLFANKDVERSPTFDSTVEERVLD